MKKIVIVGGGGAGLTAALSAKKAASDIEITIIGNEEFSYSPCALPFVLMGEIPGIDRIATKFEDICKSNNIVFHHEDAVGIDTQNKVVKTRNRDVQYDSLIITTGGYAVVPPIKGANLGNILTLYKIGDVEKIKNATANAKSAAVIGAGAIGLEAAAALHKKGIKVTLIEGLEHVLFRFFGTDFLDQIEGNIKQHDIDLVLGKNVEEIIGDKQVKAVRVAGREVPADIVIMATGVRTNIKIVEGSGIEVTGGIKVDERMETNIKGVYAAGDCTIMKSLVTGKYTPSMLGTTAIRQGIIAGTNAAGGNAIMEGVMNAMAIKLFDLEFGRVGLTEKDAKTEGIEVAIGKAKSTIPAEYYPNAKHVEVKLIFNVADSVLVGAEIIGGASIVGRIDLLCLAIAKKMTAEELMRIEYCYTPPLAPSHNAIVMAAENAHRKLKRIKERAKK